MFKNAWYNDGILPNEMVKGIIGKLNWPKLEESSHFIYLKEAIESCIHAESLLDLGCGGGEVGRVFSNLDYTGYDLKHIIEKVSKIVNTNLKFNDFDAYESDLKFCNNYDIILSNCFLSELNNCTDILEKILINAKKYIILHRQKFNDGEKIDSHITYGEMETLHCVTDLVRFKKMTDNKFNLIYNKQHPDNITQTIALEKNI